MSWTDRHGLVGDLHMKSKEELRELLLRQEKLLSNKRFIHSLPDKGKKISEFAGRVREALSQAEEAERRGDELGTVRSDFQSQYQQALTRRQPHSRTAALDLHVGSVPTQENTGEGGAPEPQHLELSGQSRTTPVRTSNRHDDSSAAKQQQGSSSLNSMETTPQQQGSELAEAMARVSLAEEGAVEGSGRPATVAPGNPFARKPPSVELVERKEKSAMEHSHAHRAKFKPNQSKIQPKSGSPSPSPSPRGVSPSPGGVSSFPGGVSPLSAEARRQRDRKHLDDITAAKLPPLHHMPAQLLSLEETHTLMTQHTHRQMELEARLSAQKLCEGWSVKRRSTHTQGAEEQDEEEEQEEEEED
ncbi:protein GRINL1A [Engraulis encrasicolus]|uniref:protein GRINL1A n=1 Tax=Engraulis encrasicolus TaxID=184585 RepID=UPI002FD3E0CB